MCQQLQQHRWHSGTSACQGGRVVIPVAQCASVWKSWLRAMQLPVGKVAAKLHPQKLNLIKGHYTKKLDHL